ncbi:17410_t:CDS:2, partial [Funneliformis caledonium]
MSFLLLVVRRNKLVQVDMCFQITDIHGADALKDKVEDTIIRSHVNVHNVTLNGEDEHEISEETEM